MENKKIVVGISGGVDSAVSAYLLKSQGYDVIGVFMQNWDSFANMENYDNNKEYCDSHYEYEDAKQICNVLNIELHKVDFIKEYWNNVFENFLNEYKKGRTPNPDVLCNKYIKFGHLLKYCLEHFQADYIATGHYAKVIHYDNHSELHTCADANKDQTYFLCDLNQQQLKHALFPLENLTKDEVRQIAKDQQLPVWNKKDSTGICFIGERNFNKFLSNYLKGTEGDIIDIDDNKIISKHQGLMYYTIGQNNKLGLSGMDQKYYVCKKDTKNNVLYVCKEQDKAKYLTSYECIINDFNWINKPRNQNNLLVRFRHRQQFIPCCIEILDDNKIVIKYQQGSMSVTEGQYAVLYEDTNCLGGGAVDIVKLPININ